MSDGSEQLFRGYTGRMLVLLTMGFLAMQLTQRVLPPLLPVIIDELRITPFEAGLALSLLSIARALSQYPSGRISDRLSRKTVILPSVGLCIVGLGLLLLSPVYVAFLASLVVFGVGYGLYDPADRALLSELFEAKRGRAFGVHMVAGEMAGILAAGIAVVVVAAWRLAFAVPFCLLLVVLAAFPRWNREPIELRRVPLDVRETVARLGRTSRVRWLLVAYVLFIFASKGVISFLPTFLVTVHDFSIGTASGAFALLYVVGTVVRPITGVLSDRFPRPVVAGSGLLLASGSLGGLILAPTPAVVLLSIAGYAIGQRGYPPPMQAFIMDIFPDESRGGDLGALRTIYMGLGSLGPTYVGYVAGRVGYPAAYAGIVACFLVASGITYRLTTGERD
ncbi:MAG: MFS transporter [Haloglomus sp.]